LGVTAAALSHLQYMVKHK